MKPELFGHYPSISLVGIKSAFADAYRAAVHPYVVDAEPTLIYEVSLGERDPAAFTALCRFAAAHGFRLREERRTSATGVTRERRGKGLVMLVLGMGLLGLSAMAPADVASSVDDSGSAVLEQASNSTPSDEFVVREMLQWLQAQQIGMDHPWQAPAVTRISQREILRLAFGEQLPQALANDGLKVYGLYNFKNETIYLHNGIDLGSIRGRAVLVHELVHYLQYRSGVNNRVRCKNELETMAYQLESRYLQAHQHKPGVGAAQIRRLSRCS